MGKETNKLERVLELEPIKTVDGEILKVNERSTREEMGGLNYFGYKMNDDGLSITIAGIPLAGGYSKLKFYEAESYGLGGIGRIKKVAVTGEHPDGRIDFMTEDMNEMVQGARKVQFYTGNNGSIISKAKMEDMIQIYGKNRYPDYEIKNGIATIMSRNGNIGIALKDLSTGERKFFINGEELRSKAYQGFEL